MTELLSDLETPSDAELISRVRGGDVAAYGELFSRHVQAANRLARQLVRGPDADDLVSDAFAKVLGVLQGGGGPDVAFRAYLLTAVRRLHVDKVRAGSRLQTSDDMTQFDPGIPFQDTAVSGFESGAAARAFASLPERWQLVLWHLEVEGQKPADIAPLLGMSANSVSALAYRAREGLRQAFLTMHLSDISADSCRWVNEHLGAYVRHGLAKRDAAKVEDHLQECRRCTAMYLELTEVNSDLKAIIAPLLLGAAATGYLASSGSAGTAGVLTLLGRVRDVITANAGVAATGAAAAGVAAVATTAVLLTQGHPGTVIGADRPIAATTHLAQSGAADAGSPAPSSRPSSAGTSPAVALASTQPGLVPSSGPSGTGTLPGTGPGTAPGTGPGSTPGTGPGSTPGTGPGAGSTSPAAPSTGPTGQPSGSPTHSPSSPGTPTGSPTHQPTRTPTGGPTSTPTGGPTSTPTGGPTSPSTGGNTGGPTGGPTSPVTTPPSSGGTETPGGGSTGGSGGSGGTTLPALATLSPSVTFDSGLNALTVSVTNLQSATSTLVVRMASGGAFTNLPKGCTSSDGIEVRCTPAYSEIADGMAAQADVTGGSYGVTLPVQATSSNVSGHLSVDGYDGSQQWTFAVAPPTDNTDLAMGVLLPSTALRDGQGVYHLAGAVSGVSPDKPVTFTIATNPPEGPVTSSVQAAFALPAGDTCAPGDAANVIVCTDLEDGQNVDFPITLTDPSGATPYAATVYITAAQSGVIDSAPDDNTASASLQAEAPQVAATTGDVQGANVPVTLNVSNLVAESRTLYIWVNDSQDPHGTSPLQASENCSADSTGRLTCSLTPQDGSVQVEVTAKAPPGQGGKDVIIHVSSIAFDAPTAGSASVHLQSVPGKS